MSDRLAPESVIGLVRNPQFAINGWLDGALQEIDPVRDDSQILEVLHQASRQIRLQRALAGSVYAALLFHIVLIPVVVLKNVLPIDAGWYVPVLLPVVTAGALLGLLARLHPLEVARRIDAHFALKERLQSALEVRDRHDDSMAKALLRDASTTAARIEPAGAFPLRLPREIRYLLPVLVLVAGLSWLPMPSLLELGASGSPGEASTENAGLDAVNGRKGSEGTDKEPAGDPKDAIPRQAWEEPKAAYRDTPFATEPPDFASFLKEADGRLSLLDPPAGLPDLEHDYDHDPHRVPVRRMPDEPAGFATRRHSQTDAGEGIEGLAESGNPGDRHEPRGKGQEAGSSQRQAKRPQAGKAEAERQQGGGSQGSPGVKSLRQTPTPERTGQTPLEQSDPSAKRYGSGEQPHDAAGGILPPWLQGPEDPHFQDAGLGDVEGTGKKSGQPGTGHADQLKGSEAPRLEVATEEDFRLFAQRRDGDWESYDSDLPGLGAKVPSRASYTELRSRYGRMAEEALSKERVPLAYREQVKRYFSAIEAGR